MKEKNIVRKSSKQRRNMSSERSPYSEFLYSVLSPILGGLITVLNVIQFYCINRIQRMEGSRGVNNNNLAYIKSLCVSDIMAGVTMIILKSINPFMKTTFKGISIFLLFIG